MPGFRAYPYTHVKNGKNIPARYAKRLYLYQHGVIIPMRGEGATHAWARGLYFLITAPAQELTFTNNCVANDTHVRLAVGRNFSDCSPVRGVYKGSSDHELEVAVSVGYEGDLQTAIASF